MPRKTEHQRTRLTRRGSLVDQKAFQAQVGERVTELGAAARICRSETCRATSWSSSAWSLISPNAKCLTALKTFGGDPVMTPRLLEA